MNLFFFAMNAGLSALNATMYVTGSHSSLSLFAAVFCAAGAVLHLVWAVAE